MWLAFLVLILFNIKISIVQEVLEMEMQKQKARKDEDVASLNRLVAQLHPRFHLF
jgi:hypothetical protein